MAYAQGRHPNPKIKTPKNATIWLSVGTNNKIEQVIEPKFKELMVGGKHYELNLQKHAFYIKNGYNNWSEVYIKSEESYLRDPQSYEGSKVHRLAFDEQPSEEVWDAAHMRTIDTNGQTLLGATLFEEHITFLWDRIIKPVQEGKPEAKNITLVGENIPMSANPMLDPTAIAEQRRQVALRSPEEAAVRFDGKYLQVFGKTPFNLDALSFFRKIQSDGVPAELYFGGEQ